ncbi:hypothetical protein F511_36483 [Dorcoceras hygrometricum]|uniref:DUF7880 domain-containing protein n=1 Tax=Dorcoceras hygrometricum TaxID=472368 RepID=A0A2Z7B5R8_9LAMI|nr:hypothetical protein F511_36483 [Dorcoceras hygrometricum]
MASASVIPQLSNFSFNRRRPPAVCSILFTPTRRLVSFSLLSLNFFSLSNEHLLEADHPKFADCRNLLRSGPASSFRVNIRAVAEYASDAGNGKSAFSAVDQCLRTLEDLDSLLLQASRNQSEAPIESMKLKVVAALDAMDSLLKFVPSEVLNKAKSMADAYYIPEEYLAPENLDPQLKKLESIL